MRHAQRGSTMVEFAISAALMLVMIFGILEFARAVYTYHTVENAARLGSRWAMVRGSDCVAARCPATTDTVKTYVQSQLPLLTAANATVTTTWANGTGCYANPANAPGCVVSVTVSYPFTFDLPFISKTLLQMSSASKMVISE
jgi:Flp pilus assembly protein TadG